MKSVLFSSIQNKFDKTYENLVRIVHIPSKVTETMISGLCFLQIFSKRKLKNCYWKYYGTFNT